MILVPEILDPVIRIDTTLHTLTNAITDYNPDAVQGEDVESVIDGTASIIYKGKRFNGEIVVYGINKALFDALRAAERTVVRLWPYGRGTIPNTNPQKYYPYVDVLLREVTPFHKDNALYLDAMIIKVKSQSYYTLTQAADTGHTES
jgi:hypothetical protein